MATLLGFPVLPQGGPRLGTFLVPGTGVKLTLAREVAPLLLAVARDFNREVESLVTGQCGGFNPRRIAGSSSWSRHAAGIAVDLNWRKHPMGKRNTFTAVQRDALDRILARYVYKGKRLIRCGKDYGTRPDDQHFEINADRAVVLAAVKALQTPAKPKPHPSGGHQPGSRVLKLDKPLMTGGDVGFCQRWTGADDDEKFGPDTRKRVVHYQQVVGLRPTGVVDAATWSRMLGRTVKF
jgi:hypothetical protein